MKVHPGPIVIGTRWLAHCSTEPVEPENVSIDHGWSASCTNSPERRVDPVIKWLDDPDRAFQHLCRYPLSELARVPTARLWPAPPRLPAKDEATAERSLALYLHATRVLSVEEQGRALMAPKLAFKARAIASKSSPEAVFEARAVAAEIGWIETSLAGAAAVAIRAVEDLLSVGHAEGSMAICRQLSVFEAFEHGLLATWETPEELVCVAA